MKFCPILIQQPYECTTCSKVFRRNCDLRRHALTHTIGGDLTSTEAKENGNIADLMLKEKNAIEDDQNDEANELDDDDDDEFDDDIQVDSPQNHERNTPSPIDPEAIDDHDNEKPPTKVATLKDGAVYHDDLLDDEPPRKMPRLEQNADENGSLGITHCHHNGGGQTHYTMRPSQPANGQAFDAKLHVRRDLHYKVDAIPSPLMHVRQSHSTSSVSTSNIGSSIPPRKRAYENPENESHPLISSSHLVSMHPTAPLNLSNHTALSRSTENANSKCNFCFSFKRNVRR